MEKWIYIALALTQLSSVYNQCFYIESSDRIKRYWNNVAFGYSNHREVRNNICLKTYNVSYMSRLKSYYYGSNLIEKMFSRCCGNSTKVDKRYFNDTSAIPPPSMSSSHFFYPVLGKEGTEKLHGYYFLPFEYVSGAIYRIIYICP